MGPLQGHYCITPHVRSLVISPKCITIPKSHLESSSGSVFCWGGWDGSPQEVTLESEIGREPSPIIKWQLEGWQDQCILKPSISGVSCQTLQGFFVKSQRREGHIINPGPQFHSPTFRNKCYSGPAPEFESWAFPHILGKSWSSCSVFSNCLEIMLGISPQLHSPFLWLE